MDLRLDDRLQRSDDGGFGVVYVFETVAVGRTVVADIVGREARLSGGPDVNTCLILLKNEIGAE